MRAFGGTCPMCCGDLDDAAYLETGAAVCLYCGHGREVSTNRTVRSAGPLVRNSSTGATGRGERVTAYGQARRRAGWLGAGLSQ